MIKRDQISKLNDLDIDRIIITNDFGLEADITEFITSLGFYESIGNTNLGSIGIVFTIIAVIGLTNAFNFIDGIDGLCASIFITSLINLLFLSYIYGNFIIYEFIIFIILITLIFLFLNISNSAFKIFLGDAGSNFLGFVTSWLLIFFTSNQINEFHQSLVIWCVTIPLFDFFSVVFKRIFHKKNPFKFDRNHIHHLLLLKGFNQNTILIFLVFLSIFLFSLGLVINFYFGNLVSIFLFLLLFVLYFFFKEIVIKKY